MADRLSELRELVRSLYVLDDDGHPVVSVSIRIRNDFLALLDVVEAARRLSRRLHIDKPTVTMGVALELGDLDDALAKLDGGDRGE